VSYSKWRKGTPEERTEYKSCIN